ncbi:MAG TPA: TlpA disulfide reductase family protein [Usitatibacter sp.]|nr:TlpA disulfide reductase family protein [Usitatibacter sp.]
MRTHRWIAAAVAFAAIAAFAAAEAPFKKWTKPTPALALPDLSGRTVDLRDFRGKVVVLNFWATWCEPCREEMPSLQRLRARMNGKPLEVLTVNFGEFPQKIEPFMKREKIELPVLLDTQKDAARDWGAGGLPITFLVDGKGEVRYWVFGERDWSEGEPLRLVESLLDEGARARR